MSDETSVQHRSHEEHFSPDVNESTIYGEMGDFDQRKEKSTMMTKAQEKWALLCIDASAA
ncbi:hypothetical protein YC2023_115893 [Brassica napus]